MSATLKVLQVFPAGRSTTNPYLVMLGQSLDRLDGVVVSNFTWWSALSSRYDVVHLHWPENLGSGHSALKRLVRQFLTVLLVLKWRVSRIAVVRTLHNIYPPMGISRRERWLLWLIERTTDHFITLNIHTPVPSGRSSTMVPHGHYRDWFGRYEPHEEVRGQFGFVGLIRGYKGVETLIESYRSIEIPGLSLLVAGNPSSDELAGEIRDLSRDGSTIRLELRFLTDSDLVSAISSSELVVLPYRFMHNSGSLLAALSLDRPVLVPRNKVTADIAAEVGAGWVYLFDHDLDGADLEDALRSVRLRVTSSRPDLSKRDWKDAGSLHMKAYRTALKTRRRRKPSSEAGVTLA